MSVHKIEIVGTMVNSLLVMSRDGKGNYRCKCQICGREFLKRLPLLEKGWLCVFVNI